MASVLTSFTLAFDPVVGENSLLYDTDQVQHPGICVSPRYSFIKQSEGEDEELDVLSAMARICS